MQRHTRSRRRVTATTFSQEEFVDILEHGILLQWKLEFKKESFDLRSATLKEFLDVYVRLEETELHKLHVKKIACAKKDHNEEKGDRKVRHHAKLELCYKRHHGHGKHHTGKYRKKFYNYHGLCHHEMEKCDYYQAHKKHPHPTHYITDKLRLRQIHFVKDA
eukprot:14717496-Ditylum_brightwellii.AAC.1